MQYFMCNSCLSCKGSAEGRSRPLSWWRLGSEESLLVRGFMFIGAKGSSLAKLLCVSQWQIWESVFTVTVKRTNRICGFIVFYKFIHTTKHFRLFQKKGTFFFTFFKNSVHQTVKAGRQELPLTYLPAFSFSLHVLIHLTLFIFPLALTVMETGKRANCWRLQWNYLCRTSQHVDS